MILLYCGLGQKEDNKTAMWILSLLNQPIEVEQKDSLNKNTAKELALKKITKMQEDLESVKNDNSKENEMKIISRYITRKEKEMTLEFLQSSNSFNLEKEELELLKSVFDNEEKFSEIYYNITKNKPIIVPIQRSACKPIFLECRTTYCGKFYVGKEFWPAAFACAWIGFWCGGGYLNYQCRQDAIIPFGWSWDF